MNISADAGVTVCTAAPAVRSPIDSVQVSPGSLAEVSLLVADLRRLAYPRTHSAGNAFSCASKNGLIFIACALVFHGVTSTTSLRNMQDEVAHVWAEIADAMRASNVRKQTDTWPVPLEYDGKEAVPKYVFLAEWVQGWFPSDWSGETAPTAASPESSAREWLRGKVSSRNVTERLSGYAIIEGRDWSVVWACTTFENLCVHFLRQKDSRLDAAHSREVVYRRVPSLLWKFGLWYGASLWWANR